MSNIYNISQHIKEIITPLMKEMGFKKQNFHFVRINGKYKEDIWIQKSQGNFSGEMNQFYINYYVYKDIESKIWNAEFRLPNKPVSECPKRYIDYYKDFSRTFRSTFSKNEENEIHSYLHQQWWTYSSEDELVKILNILALLLNDYTDKVFSVLENAIESSELSKSLVGVRDNIRLNIQNVIDYCVLNY